MAIEMHEGGGFTVTGDHITLYRLLAMKSAMSLKLKCGMEPTRGVRIFPLVKREFGLKGSPQRVYDQFCALLEKAREEGVLPQPVAVLAVKR